MAPTEDTQPREYSNFINNLVSILTPGVRYEAEVEIEKDYEMVDGLVCTRTYNVNSPPSPQPVDTFSVSGVKYDFSDHLYEEAIVERTDFLKELDRRLREQRGRKVTSEPCLGGKAYFRVTNPKEAERCARELRRMARDCFPGLSGDDAEEALHPSG